MLQVLERERGLLEKVLTIEPTPRVERLRQRYLDTKSEAVIDILRIKTRVMQETQGEPSAYRQAKAFAETVRGMPVDIYPDELFAGWLYRQPGGAILSAGQAVLMEGELDTLSTREYAPHLISDEDKRELREEIIPYWKTHLRNYAVDSLMHWTTGYEKVLRKGVLGVKRDAEERLARLDIADPEDVRKVIFLRGVITGMEAAGEIGERFSAKARELAKQEADRERKAELLKIAEVCDRVPAHPARTFHEALQSVWFTHILHAWDNEWSWGMGPGRADQYLYPYYKRDIEEERLTKEDAQELIDCWFMRFGMIIWPIWGTDISRWAGSPAPGMHMDVGGLNPDGTDGTTELSYMFIEARMHTLAFVEPTLGLLVHSKTREDLLIKACQLTALGGGYPMFINQDVMVENLLARGEILDGPPITLALARKGCTIGCHEPTIPNMTSGWIASSVNLGSAMELVLTNGRSRTSPRVRGLETGDPRQFRSFEEFREAYGRQVAFLLRNGVIELNISELALQPKVFTSALTEDCIEEGISSNEGGARYNVGAVGMVSTVDAGNSLASIKKLIYDDKKITMDQLCQALEKNFRDHEDIRKMCLEVPKFGNDDDSVDEQVAWVTHAVTEEAKKYKTAYGGRKLTVQVPMYGYVPAGLVVGALPSGRLAGEPLADGVSAQKGSDVKGPTALLKSVGKVNNAEVSLSQTLNMRVDPVVFEKEDGFKRLADLIRVFADQKVDHLQINVVATDTLEAAQKEPDEYRELTVKVAGYNARFVELNRELQDSIIARTEHGL